MTVPSDLPLRFAAAVVIWNSGGEVLLARRSHLVDEFAGAWSLPSSFIDSGTREEDIPFSLATKVEAWLGLELSSLRLLRIRHGIRPAWLLRMNLYGTACDQRPVLRNAKYDAIQWVNGPAYFRRCNVGKLGDCGKAYLEYLDENAAAHRAI